jgi:hypothetical protein
VGPPPEYPLFDMANAKELFMFVSGVVILVLGGPPIAIVVLSSLLWEAADRGFSGGFLQSGRELSGFLCARVAPWVTAKTQSFNARFVKKVDDTYMINCIVAYGLVVPMMYAGFAYYYWCHGWSWLAVFVYHVLRLGPFFMNFAYVYTLCHKEGHSHAGLYTMPYNRWTVVRNVFNWWIGMFYGVLPATFAIGHSINHHRYNNGQFDVVTTSDKPRDSFVNWVGYLPRWFIYAINISTSIQFALEGQMRIAKKVMVGTLYFFTWLAINAAIFGRFFTMAYLFFPFVEANILLAAVNWSWHAFLDPQDPENEFVQSITILEGSVNVLNEDAHLVHHQYPAAHWTDHPKHLQAHWASYAEHRGSVFCRTHAFEIWGMVVCRNYEELARKWVDLRGERDGQALSHEERVNLMKSRLRACWWGPRADPEVTARLSGKEVGNRDFGKGAAFAAPIQAKKSE